MQSVNAPGQPSSTALSIQNAIRICHGQPDRKPAEEHGVKAPQQSFSETGTQGFLVLPSRNKFGEVGNSAARALSGSSNEVYTREVPLYCMSQCHCLSSSSPQMGGAGIGFAFSCAYPGLESVDSRARARNR